MNKRSYLILILMPVALLGLILIQVYWVKSAVDSKEEEFSYSITQVLNSVSQSIERREMNKYINRFIELKAKDSLGTLKSGQVRDFVFIQENKNTRETFIYNHGILEEDYTIPSEFFNISGSDSASIRNYVSKQTSRTLSEGTVLDGKKWITNQATETMKRFNSFDKLIFEESLREISGKLPLVDRVDKLQVEELLRQELTDRGILLNFQYAIYDYRNSIEGLVTNVKSDKFNQNSENLYSVPLFQSDMSDSKYKLIVTFPERNRYLLSSIVTMAVFAFIFTSIIIWVFTRTLIQLRTQKQISEMKTDFINNMTHEFKTPIATINLALDAMKNPQVMQDPERFKGYLKMLRDENKRMHAQVENVLRISKLDRNQLEIEKEPLDAHELIENAIMHVQLLVDDRGGIIRKHLHAENSDVLANELHFTNVLVNVLENAIKYSPNAPEIDVFTEILGKYILIKIQDKGAGMNKAVLKKIFEKFYREHTGDIHNVKGHGLGLAYVKRVVKDHQGEVYAESEKEKGSTFFIKIPLII